MSFRVLITDDEFHVVDVLSMKLAKAGYDVLVARDGQEALDLCRQEPPDLLITDCQMPRMNGLELCEALTALPATRSMPRIMLTSRDFEIGPETRQKLGIRAIIGKPFGPRSVLAEVARLLGVEEAGGSEAEGAPAAEVAVSGDVPAAPVSEIEELRRLAAAVQEPIASLGLSLRVFGCAGEKACAFHSENAYCRLSCGDAQACLQAQGQLAGEVLSGEAPVGRVTDTLCLLVGVPVWQRRRLIGVAVAGCPTRDRLTDESIEHFAQRQSLRLPQARDACRKACRHTAEELDDIEAIVSMVLRGHMQDTQISGELSAISTNLASTYEELALVYRISGAVKVTQRPQDFLQTVCNELLEVMNIEAAVAIAYSRLERQSDIIVSAGTMDLNPQQIQMLATIVANSPTLEDPSFLVNNHFRAPAGSGLGRAVQSFVAATLVTGDSPRGLLMGLNKQRGEFDSVDLKLIGSIGSQAAVFLANHALYADLQDLLMGLLHTLTASIDAKDAYTRGHSERVAQISRILAERLGLPQLDVERIYLSGLLHDIGKIGVPESILCKAGKLDDDEFEKIKEHPGIGKRILMGIRQLEGVVHGVVTHHERFDGRGYPNKLTGEQIPMDGRIVGLADSFDAMTSSRTYRKAMDIGAVREEIARCAGGQFDPEIVRVFLELDAEELMDWLYDPAAIADRQHAHPAKLLQSVASGSIVPRPGYPGSLDSAGEGAKSDKLAKIATATEVDLPQSR